MPIDFAIERFLGRNTDDLGVLIDPGYSDICLDVDFTTLRGRLQSAKGTFQVHENTGANWLGMTIGYIPLHTNSTELYSGDSKIRNWGNGKDYTHIQGQSVLVNGTESIRVRGSTSDFSLGITAPDQSSMTATATGTGSFDVGDWAYRVTFVDTDGFESDTDTTNAVTVTSAASKTHVALANIPTGDADEDVAQRIIYRTQDGGSVYYKLTTIADNSTTTYNDSITDANLGSTTYPTNQDPAPSDLIVIEECNDRLWGVKSSDQTRLYYSKLTDNFKAWPATYYYQFAYDIWALKSYGRGMLVFTVRGPRFFVPTDNINTQYDTALEDRVPVEDTLGQTRFRGKMYFRGPKGIHVTDGVSVDMISKSQKALFGTIISSANPCMTSDEDTIYLVEQSSTLTGYVLFIESEFNMSHVLYTGTYLGIEYDPINKILYGVDSGGVDTLKSTTNRAWNWRSVDSYLGYPRHYKNLDRVTAWINGTVTVEIWADGTSVFSKQIVNTSMQREEIDISPDIRGHRFKVEFTASAGGEVDPPFIYWFRVEGLDTDGRLMGATKQTS